MDRELRRTIWPIFLGEATENLRELGAAILALETEHEAGRAELVRGACRLSHSLKGSAASLGLEDFAGLAHALEDALLSAGVAPAASTIDAALLALQALEAALERGEREADDRIPGLPGLVAALRRAPAAPLAEEPAIELWPVFREEAREQLAALGEVGIPGAVGQGAKAARLAGALAGAAATLKLEELEAVAAAIEELLRGAGEAPLAPARRAALAEACSGIQAAFGELDAGGPGRVPEEARLLAALREATAPREPAAVPVLASPPGEEELEPAGRVASFAVEVAEAGAALRRQLAILCSPDAAARPAAIGEGTRTARQLGAAAGAAGQQAIAELCARIEAELARAEAPGPEASRAVSALADHVLALKGALTAAPADRGALGDHVLASKGALTAAPADRVLASKGALTAAPADRPEAAPAPQPRAPAEGPAESRSAASGTIRVSVAVLDSLALQLEELAQARVRQERRARELKALAAAIAAANLALRRTAGELRQREPSGAAALDVTSAELRRLQLQLALAGSTMRRDSEHLALVGAVVRQDLRELRTVPASVALEPLRRTVRELAGRLGKQVRVTLSGQEVRLDRRIVDELKDPLVHLVRNSLDHGIEPAEVRQRQGKPAEGHLQVTVEQRGNRIRLELADDGGGLDLGRVRELAVARGLVRKEELLALSEQEVARLIFRPGFSTAAKLTEISGRGVGLDVVQSTAVRLGGSVDVSFTPGKGTRFVLDLPLTIAAVGAILVRAGGILVAFPAEAVEHLLRVGRADVVTVAGRPTCKVGEARIPVATLAQVLDLPRGRQLPDGAEAQQALLLAVGQHRRVLLVEEVVGLQELIVQSLGRQLPRAVHLSGAAILDDGTVVPVLETSRLLEQAGERAAAAGGAERIRIVVADDSLTTRSAMKAVLELAGFEVIPAVDGADALRLCEMHHPALVVSDVQMPNLDGLGLTRALRADPSLSATPVILVTSLDSAEDRAAGLSAGADGYLVKRDVERGKLLELVQSLAPGRA